MLKRCKNNPILTRADIPDVPPYATDVTSVFNPGANGIKQMILHQITNRLVSFGFGG